MAFWVNSPTETTPLSASNLSRMEKYTTATAGSNGDFYVTINNSSGLATGDVVKITFPSATDNTVNARLSIDGGTTYKNIYMGENLLGSAVENKEIELMYNGTQFEPMCEITDTTTNGTWIKNPNGRMTVLQKISKSLTFSGAWGTLYGSGDTSLGDFLKPFISVPTVNVSNITGSASMIMGSLKSTTTSSIGVIELYRATVASTVACELQITAIGRWK